MWNDHLEPVNEIAGSDGPGVLRYLDEAIILAVRRFPVHQAMRMVIAERT